MFSVEMLPGGHGDALVVEYGTKAQPHQLLIDAGTAHAWGDVRERLMSRNSDRYEIFVITHIDEDHIGGAISLLDDPDLNARISCVWFNGFVHCERGGNVLGPVNGEELTLRLVEGSGLQWNKTPATDTQWGGFTPKMSDHIGGPIVVPSKGDLPCIPLPGGATVVLLSPSGSKLKTLAKKWKEVVEKAGLVPGEGTEGHTTAPSPHDRAVKPLPDPLDRNAVAALAGKNATDGSEANGSSIAFILEYDGKRALFAADAHAPLLTESIKRYAERVGEERPRIDLFKLAHHGSNSNISGELLEAMDCHRFLISTNGDNFAHPDDAAIAKVISTCQAPVSFFCNYRTSRTAPWAAQADNFGASFTFPKEGRHGLLVAV